MFVSQCVSGIACKYVSVFTFVCLCVCVSVCLCVSVPVCFTLGLCVSVPVCFTLSLCVSVSVCFSVTTHVLVNSVHTEWGEEEVYRIDNLSDTDHLAVCHRAVCVTCIVC